MPGRYRPSLDRRVHRHIPRDLTLILSPLGFRWARRLQGLRPGVPLQPGILLGLLFGRAQDRRRAGGISDAVVAADGDTDEPDPCHVDILELNIQLVAAADRARLPVSILVALHVSLPHARAEA